MLIHISHVINRFKREKTLELVKTGNADKQAITNLIMSPPGLEEYQGIVPTASTMASKLTTLNDIRKENIRKSFLRKDNLMPRDTRTRTHRKNQSAMNGTMSFLELGSLVNTSWKSVDEFAKGIFNELADEGREAYRALMNDYNSAMEERKNTVCLTVPTIHLGAKEIDTVKAMMKLPKSGSSVYSGYAKKVSPNPSMTSNDIYQRKVSNDDSPMLGSYHHQKQQQHYQHHSLPNSSENEALLRRVAELEERLAAERLQMRVRQLEFEIERRKASEERMRAELMLRRYSDSSRSSMQVQAQIQEMTQATNEEKQTSFFTQTQGYPKSKVDFNGPNKKQRLV